MALIKCEECGKKISDTVKNCIHCGNLIKKPKKESFMKGFFIGVGIVASITIVLIILILTNK